MDMLWYNYFFCLSMHFFLQFISFFLVIRKTLFACAFGSTAQLLNGNIACILVAVCEHERRLHSRSCSGVMSSSLLLAVLPPVCVGLDAILSSLPSLSQSSGQRIRLLYCVLLVQRSTQPRHLSQLAANPLSGSIQARPHAHTAPAGPLLGFSTSLEWLVVLLCIELFKCSWSKL